MIKSTTAPDIDGVIAQQEWQQAVKLEFKTDFEVGLTYTDTDLYLVFYHVKDARGIRNNAEVMLQTATTATEWNDETFWFHTSYANCSAQGQFFFWENCTPNPTDWESNKFPLDPKHNVLEFRISFKKLGIKPTAGTTIKLSCKYSDPKETHHYWPQDAKIDDPKTWGTVQF